VGLSVVAARTLVGRRPEATEQLPFGPYLAIGVWLTWLYWPPVDWWPFGAWFWLAG